MFNLSAFASSALNWSNFAFSNAAIAITAVITLASMNEAKADHVENAAFSQAVEALNTYSHLVHVERLFDNTTNESHLSQSELDQLTALAKSQAEIWGDTILESTYEADGQTQVDRVEALKLDGQIAAFRILYSQRSWDTSTCEGQPDSLDKCVEGRIQEASFVSTDLSSWMRDPKQLAVFLAQAAKKPL